MARFSTQWIEQDGARGIRIEDISKKEAIFVPKDKIRTPSPKYGETDMFEQFVSKWSNDVSDSLDAKKKLLIGGSDKDALIASLMAKVAELEAKSK